MDEDPEPYVEMQSDAQFRWFLSTLDPRKVKRERTPLGEIARRQLKEHP